MREIEASLKYIKGSFYKLNLVADMVLKRSMPRGRGRATRIEKRFSNLRINFSEKKIDNKKSVKSI